MEEPKAYSPQKLLKLKAEQRQVGLDRWIEQINGCLLNRWTKNSKDCQVSVSNITQYPASIGPFMDDITEAYRSAGWDITRYSDTWIFKFSE